MKDPVDDLAMPASEKSSEVFDAPPRRVFQTTELMGPEKEVGLVHDGALYRLRSTRSGKLILTK